MVTVPVWVLWAAGAWIVLSSAANAMSDKDRSFYGFLRRFLLNLTNSAREEFTQLHLAVPLPPQVPTQADVSDPSAAPAQN